MQQCRHVYETHEREHMAIGSCITQEQAASLAQSICIVPSFCTCLDGISMCAKRGSQATVRPKYEILSQCLISLQYLSLLCSI